MRIRRSQEDSDMLGAVLAAQVAKDRMIEAEESFKKAQARLVEMIKEKDQKSTSVRAGNTIIKATVVQAEQVKIDEPGLRKALGAKVYDDLCVKKIDKNKLREAVTEKKVDAVVVAQHTEVSLGSAYIKFSETKEIDEQ
jgi:hypothetical protein